MWLMQCNTEVSAQEAFSFTDQVTPRQYATYYASHYGQTQQSIEITCVSPWSAKIFTVFYHLFMSDFL